MDSHLKAQTDKNEYVKKLLQEKKYPLFKIIEECEREKLCEREVFWINQYQSPDLLNVARGGNGGDTGRSKDKWKPVVGKNMETGTIVHYKYVWETEKDGFYPSTVSGVCLGKKKSHRGYYFAFDNKDLPVEELFKKPKYKTKKPIICTVMETGEKFEFDSIKEAAEKFKINVATISHHLNGKTVCRKYDFVCKSICDG